eukprot:UN12698
MMTEYLIYSESKVVQLVTFVHVKMVYQQRMKIVKLVNQIVNLVILVMF